MKALIYKEIKENLKFWGGILGFGILLVVFYTIENNYRSICNRDFLAWTTMGSIIAGLVIGFLTVKETFFKQWEFFLHRPATRTSLFMGKIYGGLILYFTVTGIPFLLAAAWSAIPGNIAAPFVWRMILPGTADILMGTSFYFAAVLAGMTIARWYWSRLTGIALASVCAAAVNAVPEFWQALLAVIVADAVLFAAAWGSFITRGTYKRQPWISKTALSICIIASLVIVQCIAVGIIFELAKDNNRYRSSETVWENYRITRKGKIVKIKRKSGHIISITDMNGIPLSIEDPSGSSNKNSQFIDYRYISSRFWSPSYREYSRYIGTFGLYGSNEHYYFYLKHKGYIAGYSKETGHRSFTAGPEGFFFNGKNPDTQFEGPILNQPLLDFGILTYSNGVYTIDFQHKEIKKILGQAEGDGPLLHFLKVDANNSFNYIGVSANKIYVLSKDRNLLFSAPLKHSIKEASIGVGMIPPEKYFIRYSPNFYSNKKEIQDCIIEVDSEGKTIGRYMLPPLNINNKIYEQKKISSLFGIVFPPGSVLALKAGAEIIRASVTDPYTVYHFSLLDEAIPLLFYIVSVISGLVCAGINYMLSGVYALDKKGRMLWSVWGFLMGITGILLFLVLYGRLIRFACAFCSKKRVPNRKQCEHCGKEFPQPEPKGIEIFE